MDIRKSLPGRSSLMTTLSRQEALSRERLQPGLHHCRDVRRLCRVSTIPMPSTASCRTFCREANRLIVRALRVLRPLVDHRSTGTRAVARYLGHHTDVEKKTSSERWRSYKNFSGRALLEKKSNSLRKKNFQRKKNLPTKKNLYVKKNSMTLKKKSICEKKITCVEKKTSSE